MMRDLDIYPCASCGNLQLERIKFVYELPTSSIGLDSPRLTL